MDVKSDPSRWLADFLRRRLANQRIEQSVFRKPEEVVRWLVASQAQDFAGAKWALGLRAPGITERVVEEAFAAGKILRTHVLRPTWHFVLPADIRWLLALTGPRVLSANAGMARKLELEAATFRKSDAVLGKALAGGRRLTREELSVALERHGIANAKGQRLAYLVMHAELQAVVCSGARRGKQFTYALLDECAPAAKTFDRESALAELARRFIQSRGPVSVRDLAKWSGLTLSDARAGLEAVRGKFTGETIEGETYWSSPGPAPRVETPRAHLLSIYDEYISSYKGGGNFLVDPPLASRLVAMGNDLTSVVILDGRIVGTWKREIAKDVARVSATIFSPRKKEEKRAIEEAAQRYAAFLGLRMELALG